MRKIYSLTIAMVCISVVSNAQISKGSTFLGGSLSFSNFSNKNENSPLYNSESTSWNINPQFGKAIDENKIVGLFLSYGRSTNNNTNGVGTEEKTKQSSYGGGVFYRRYFPVSTRFFLFGESTLGFSLGDQERTQANVVLNTVDRTSFNLALTPGISFAAGRKVHLEASLNNLFNAFYQASKQKDYSTNGTITDTYNQKQFGVGVNANGFSGLAVGLRWILPSK